MRYARFAGRSEIFIRRADTVKKKKRKRSLYAQKISSKVPIFIGNFSFFITKMPFKGQIF